MNPEHVTVRQEKQDCIDTCVECAQVCLEGVRHCLEKGGAHAEANHIILMNDCAEICQVAANFLLRNSRMSSTLCEACAIVCGECAADCDAFEDDPHMRNCVQICERCVETCEVMADLEQTGEEEEE